MIDDIKKDIRRAADPKKKVILQRFFKTGPGEYGEGDVFLGVMVPQSRKIAHRYRNLPFSGIRTLLDSSIHEERLIALFILVHNFEKGSVEEKKSIFDFYITHTGKINNWDLVDLSADKIVGAWILKRPKSVLYKLARSKNMWERRIAIIATFNFIKHQEFNDTLRIAKLLLHDKEDLIHKAVGWMLREVGKRSITREEHFLQLHYNSMPRTMLRYAIERFPKRKREAYLKGAV